MSSPKPATLSDRSFERIFVTLVTWLMIGAYVDAWDNIRPVGTPSRLGPWQEALIDGSWLCLSLFLLVVMLMNRRRGIPFSRALPVGYDIALWSCLVFAMGVMLDPYWRAAFGRGIGLDLLFAPTRLVALGAGIVLVSAPLRAALVRRDPVANLPVLVSASLLYASLSFATQFASPGVEPLAARGIGEPAVVPSWIGVNLGVSEIVLQSLLAGAVVMFLARTPRLRPGALTLVFALNGVLVATLKGWVEYVPAAALTGLAGDTLLLVLRPSRERPWHFRALAAMVPALYAAFYLLTVIILHSTSWSTTVVAGSIVMPAMLGWLLSFVALPYEGRVAYSGATAAEPMVAEADVKAALEALHQARRLAATPLARLPCVSNSDLDIGTELRELLTRIIRDLAASSSPRDAESGRILLDYYVRRIGAHETVMEPMHMSKQTYFRRLDKGVALVAERLDELSEQAVQAGI